MTKTIKEQIFAFFHQYKKIIIPVSCIILAVSIAAVVRMIFLFKDEYATGFDGYYYALQIQSLFKNGEILNNDNSIVFPILGFFSFFFNDYVFSNKIAVIILCSLISVPFFLLLYHMTGSNSISLAITVLFNISYSQIYMSFEILKNGISILFIMSFFFCMFCIKKNNWYRIGALICFLLGFMTHKVTAASMIVFVAVFIPLLVFVYRKKLFKNISLPYIGIGIGVLLFVAAAVLFSFSTLRLVDIFNLFQQFSLTTVLGRFEMIVTEVADIRIKTELFLLYIIPVIFIPFLILIIRDKTIDVFRKLFILSLFITQLVLVNPFFFFSWVSMSYRLVVMSIIFTAVELGLVFWYLKTRIPLPAVYSLLGIFLVLGFLTLPGMYTRFHANRYPPYKEMHSSIMKLKEHLSENNKLITHSGLSFFIWYETGIYTEHFTPEDNTNYYRLAYGIGPVHFKRYENELFYEEPAAIHPPYFLVKEEMWQAFVEEKKDKIKLIKSWQNPYAARPSYVYAVKDKFKY